MKRLAILVVLATTSLLAASPGEGLLGTRTEGASTPVNALPASPNMPWLQMLVALAVVLVLLKVVLPRVVGRLNKQILPQSGSIRIEESANFAHGSLYLVGVRGKTLLLCANGTSVTCLADVTDAPGTADVPIFKDYVDEALVAPAKKTSSASPPARAAVDDIDAALERLEKLAR